MFFWGLFFFCFYSIQLQSFLRASCNASKTQVTIHNSCLNAHVGCSARHVLSHTSDMACKPFSQALGKVPVSLGQKLPLSLFVMRKSMLILEENYQKKKKGKMKHYLSWITYTKFDVKALDI